MRSLLLVPLGLLASCATPPATAPSDERPNIVYILADDLGFGELGCYGQTKIRTPNLDRLAAEGMRFTRHYAGAPVCAPSRCVLLTGKHGGHATVRANKAVQPEGQWPIRAEDVTIAEVLRERGYVSAAIGKWGLGPAGSSGDPNAQGFDRFFGYICQRVAHSYYPPWLWQDGERLLQNDPPVPGHDRPAPGPIDFAKYRGENYAPEAMLAEAKRFLRANRDRPFFLYFAPLEPHVAMQPPGEWVARYPEAWDAAPYRGTRGYLPHARPRAGYAAMISYLDWQVGELVKLVDGLGLAERTIVIFSSDNGPTHDVGGVDTEFFASAGGLRGRKGSVFEGGLRVPMIARWKGRIAPRTTSAHPSAFYDVLPTLAELAGAKVPAGADGTSFVPTLLRRGQQAFRPLVFEFHGYGGQQALVFGEGGRFKALRRGLRRRPGAMQLYDLAADPGETRDLAAERPALALSAAEILAVEHEAARDFPLGGLDGPGSR